jgi:hypothetical protein
LVGIALALLYEAMATSSAAVAGPLVALGAALIPLAWDVTRGNRPSGLALVGVVVAISSLLRTDEIGGPSIRPYQAEDFWANLNFPERKYLSSTGTDQHRRGLYVHWQRTFIHPMMAAFDAPSREECAVDRFQSNSPQQALALLNDPTFVEAAKALATRLEAEVPGGSDADKITRAYLLAISREPTAKEKENLLTFLEKLRKEIPDANPTEQLCRVILNLHETITRF